MVAMAVYAFTFGRYAADALALDALGAGLLSVGIVAVFLVVNARGVRRSSATEDVAVVTKLAILAGIACIGLAHFDASDLVPLAGRGVSGLFLGTATVFFAYEGFELISYDRVDMRDPERTVPRALLLSVAVAVAAAVYVSVTIGAQMLVSNATIVASKEIPFITVVRAALGEMGRWHQRPCCSLLLARA
jgi:amino acid transporter